MKRKPTQYTLIAAALLAAALVVVIYREAGGRLAPAAPLLAAALAFGAAEILRQRVERWKLLSELRKEIQAIYIQIARAFTRSVWEEAQADYMAASALASAVLVTCDQLRLQDRDAIVELAGIGADTAGALRAVPERERVPPRRDAILLAANERLRKVQIAKWLRARFDE